MGLVHKKTQKDALVTPDKKVRTKVARIKLQFDAELEMLSGTILFPEKLKKANAFLSAKK